MERKFDNEIWGFYQDNDGSLSLDSNLGTNSEKNICKIVFSDKLTEDEIKEYKNIISQSPNMHRAIFEAKTLLENFDKHTKSGMALIMLNSIKL